jgi:Flp pilus assembly CpaE family ATPase
LLIETDLHSGTLSMLLNVSSELSIVDALENVHWLRDEIWGRLHTRALGIDILTAPSAVKAAQLVEWNCQRLLTFVRSRYETVIVDLPEVINDATASIVTQAKAVYLVCTPEMPSLFLAKRRMQELYARGVWNSRLGIAVTRHTHRDPKIEAIEKILQAQVAVVFPNDYFGVRAATRLQIVERRVDRRERKEHAKPVERHARLNVRAKAVPMAPDPIMPTVITPAIFA